MLTDSNVKVVLLNIFAGINRCDWIAQGVVQVNLLVGRQVSSFFDGAIAWLNYADRLYQLPLGIVGIGIGVAFSLAFGAAEADRRKKRDRDDDGDRGASD